MSRAFNYIIFNSVRNASSNVAKYAAVESTASAKKTEYYKNMGANQHIDDTTKPEGWDQAIPFNKMPGPKAFPLIGALWKFLPGIGEFSGLEILDWQNKLLQRYGPVIRFGGHFMKKDMVFLFSPEDFEWLYRNEGVWPARRSIETIPYYREHVRPDAFKSMGGLLTTEGFDWFQIRTKVNPILMQPRMAQQYVEIMDTVANDFITKIRHLAKANSQGEMPENFDNELNLWAFESIGVIALDRRFGCLDLNFKYSDLPLIEHTLQVFHYMYKLDVLPSLWKIYSTKDWKAYVKHLNYITDTCIQYINEAQEKIKNQPTKKTEHEMSIFEKLLAIDPNVAIAMTMDMLTAGIDTTSRTTGAVLYFLAKNPPVQEKLREELRKVLPEKNTPVTKEIFAETPYLKGTIKESARIAPIAGGTLRTLLKDIVISGYRVPKGTDVVTNNILACHSEKQFAKSDEFIPERWLRTTTDELSHKNANPFVYLPFGFGPRSCVGKRLANLEMEVVIAKIIRNFYLEWPHEDMTFKAELFYGMAKPLKLHVKEVST